MSEEKAVAVKEKEPLFSSKIKRTFSDPISDNNPITIQTLGICSALAVTTQLKPAIAMAVAVTIVCGCSNVIISLIRNYIPNKIRIIVELAVVATAVILVDQLLRAYAYELSTKLGAFVGLIITNCIIMGRLEAYAIGNKPWPSFVDGIGNGMGYGIILIVIGAIRELFGSGTLLDLKIIPEGMYALGYANNGLLLFPPGAFFILGLIIWFQRSRSGHVEH
ncbi:MAG: NADH:ubiquinone reductase (Na(+)-transporting) subunit D [Calditrichaeota bacterium]|nr:NADH:ubiquinone reductase (Na(+)-transporting) subunit D [Calditrichota bacterium]